MEFLRRLVRNSSDKYGWEITSITAAGASIILVNGLIWCLRDYKKYLALGPGGPPYNVVGWAGITLLIRPFALGKQYTTWTGDYPRDDVHEEIKALPPRNGKRPTCGGIAPHRQLSQNAPEHMKESIRNLFTNSAAQNPHLLEIRRSGYERLHDALFVAEDFLKKYGRVQDVSRLPETAVIAHGEIGHMHEDMSSHLYMSRADARMVIEKGWAERHRLAVPRHYWVKNIAGVADTYLIIYGPRDETEMIVLETILRHSIRFMTGREIDPIEWRSILQKVRAPTLPSEAGT